MIEKQVNCFPWENTIQTSTPTPGTPNSLTNMFTLRRCENQNLSKPLSHIPAKNHTGEAIMKYNQDFPKYKVCNNEFYKTLPHGNQKEIAFHSLKATSEVSPKRPQTLQINEQSKKSPQSTRRVFKEPDQEIPLIDQLLSKRNTNVKCRKELVPVDDKAKLYFAYNRNSGTITRVIATSPRPFKFGKK